MSNDRLTMTNLYQRLKEIGFTKEFIRSIGLPSWWVDELDKTVNTSTIYEGAGHIASRLHLDLRSMLNPNRKIEFINDLDYLQVISILLIEQRCLKRLQELTNSCIFKPDTLDYFEQLINYDI